MSDAKIRLYVDQPLATGQAVALSEAQANYLFNVMRLGRGAAVALFNGRDGEWQATVAETGKRSGVLIALALWLVLRPTQAAVPLQTPTASASTTTGR